MPPSFFRHELGDVADEFRLVHLVRYFGDENAEGAGSFFHNFLLRASRSSPLPVGRRLNIFAVVNDAAGGGVRAR